MPRFLLLFSGALLWSYCLLAQDAHYWSSNYGPSVLLTPGSVIASSRDSGVLFYNPALLSLSNKNRIAISSITANIYQLEAIKVTNGTGAGRHLRSTSMRIVPQMLSGSISLGKKAPVVIAYALINSPGFRFLSSQRRDERFNVLDDDYSPGPEYFVGDYVVENRVSETTALLSTGFKLTPKLSAGISVEGQIHQQHYSQTSNARALANSNIDSSQLPLVSTNTYYLANYVQAGLRFKAGLAYDMGRHHLGLVVSSPLVRLWGRGSIVADEEINNLRLVPDADIFLSLLANTRQEGLRARWRMPVSIAAGYALDFRRAQLYLATEYFFRVKDYDILTPRKEAFIRPDTGINNTETYSLLRLHDARKAVMNVALGASYQLKPSITAYASVRTDMSYADRALNADGTTSYNAYWNNVHLALGANFKRQKFNFRTGFLLSYGLTHKYPQDINFDMPAEENFLQGNPVNTKARRLGAGFMLSYIHNL
ncbi:hypothetical protein F0L74_10430 [Chitinophaga agrisoli]|uniref:Long-subunit fatty acid transport protein n=1 Tax=Chitinophaga agrisoli TaxID=2607653 RepID=A0A5B2VT07_9BACT|nr:hypothetical protein [Chitinophaga agrisoli]KAA2242933.1 hypothetical protein F0L74_10430 [Chitinophaga agrisoli]